VSKLLKTISQYIIQTVGVLYLKMFCVHGNVSVSQEGLNVGELNNENL